MDQARHAVIRRYGPLLDVSVDGRQPLDGGAHALLAQQLEYTHVEQLYGVDAIDGETGERQRVRLEPRRLYRYDPRGRLMCGAGYAPRVYRTLQKAGYQVQYTDLTEYHAEALAPDWPRLRRHFSFRPKQEEIVAAVAAQVGHRLGGVVQVPPGVGKSFLFAAYGLLYPQAKIGITAPDIDNCSKTHIHMLNYLPNVGMVGGGQHQQRRVTVYTGGSLHHCPEDVDILFVDEAHRYMAARKSEVLGRVAPRALRYAFTATPEGRTDGGDARMEGLFGPLTYRMTWPEATTLGLVVPIEVRWLNIEMDKNPCKDLEGVQKKKVGIWRNKVRNQRIAAAARTFDADDQVLIMVATIEHAVHLRSFLPEFQLCYATHDVDKFEKYAAGGLVEADFAPMTPERREQLRLDFECGEVQKVIATDVWATGVSFDQLAVLIRADARRSTILDEQIPGRVSRTHAPSGKAVGILIDCNDRFDHGLHTGSTARKHNYLERGWAQTSMTA
jgi:superfamily II DNA or RNA helicase